MSRPISMLLSSACMILVAVAVHADPPRSSTATKDLERVAEAERTWARALETGDVRALESFVDDACTFIGPDGDFEERDAYLEGYRQLPKLGVRVRKVDIDGSRTRLLGDTAVVTGHVLAHIEAQGRAVVEDVRFTRVYARRGERWRMVAGQGTRVTPPPAASDSH